MKELETIFDHGVTEEELRILFGNTRMNRDKYQEIIDTTIKKEQNLLTDLYRLYIIRRDNVTAQKFLDKIEDNIFKYFTLLNHCIAK